MTSDLELGGNSGIRRLLDEAFGPGVTVLSKHDVALGRGTFSDVYRLELAGEASTAPPSSLVAKLPAGNVNREAARTSGAYKREATAYRLLLPGSPIRSPDLFAVVVSDDLAAFLLEDLTGLRHVDQLDGLSADDAMAVAGALARFHDHWRRRLAVPGNAAEEAGVRRSTVSAFKLDTLTAGVQAVRERWPEVDDGQIQAFADVVAKADQLIELFTAAGQSGAGRSDAVTLCHGDPRADNLAFDHDDQPVVFDWQQTAVQFGEADLAWLTATSLDPGVRRALDEDLVEVYRGSTDRYRLGFVLPGLAALYLAQRQADHERTRRFIATSLQRIGTALADYEVALLA